MSGNVKLTVDGREIAAAPGEKLLWAALEHGIYIPNLCAMPGTPRPAASCRLCFVEVEGYDKPVTACTLPVKAGMKVQTRSSRVDRLVRTAFELLLSDHRLRCAGCPKNRNCELQRIARERGLKLKLTRLKPLEREFTVDDSRAEMVFDPSRCVLCGRCVRVDREEVRAGVIGFTRRGLQRRVSTFEDRPLAHTACTACVACADVCPTGAMYRKT